MQRRIMTLVGAGLFVALVGMGSWSREVFAAGNRTVYVDDTGTANVSQRGKCGRPNYATIQAAVDDVSDSRIVVCEGTYTEQVTVTRSLTLEGRSGAVIQGPDVLGSSSSIVTFVGPQESRLRGLTITAATTTDENLTAGVAVVDGAQVTIARNHIHDIPDTSPVYQTGNGIYVSGGQADITDNVIERYGFEGIVLFGTNTFAMIDDNHIREPLGDAQIGIDIREGAKADVEDNTVLGNSSEGSAGIVVDQTDTVSLRDNTVTHNALGIVLGDETGNVEVRGNVVRNNSSHGIFLTDASFNTIVENESDHNGGAGIWLETSPSEPNAFNNTIRTNKVHDNAGDGIHLGLGVINTTAKENRVVNNGGSDIVDANGGPPANVYNDNRCGTSSPSGLCTD